MNSEEPVRGKEHGDAAQLAFALEVAGIGTWELDLPTGQFSCSATCDRIFGHDSPAPHWNYEVFLNEHTHPDDRTSVSLAFQRTLENLEDLEVQYRIIQPDGQIRWIWQRGGIQRDAAGSPARLLGLVQDITARKVIEQEHEKLFTVLEFERKRLFTIFERTPALLATLLGPEHVYDLANAAYREFVGNRELIGKPVREALPELDGQGIFELLDDVYRTGESRLIRGMRLVPRRGAQGKEAELYLDFLLQPITKVDGSMAGIFVHATDITEYRRTLADLEQARNDLEHRVEERTADLQAANSELESFSYSVSHDLRAPLRGIAGFTQVLLDDYGEVLDETAQRYLQRVQASAERMGHLINDLLRLSRLSQSPMKPQVLDLSRLASVVTDELRTAEPERPVTVTIQEPLPATGDLGLLNLVLANLLGNAWKFTREREHALIEFGAENLEGEAVYFVRDNGVGFDMQYAARLFGPFQRLHSPDEFAGIGIGLAIVQRIIHQHHGRVWAEAEVGKGATFYFTLPDRQPEAGK
jgi:signal transduction histidine kinase